MNWNLFFHFYYRSSGELKPYAMNSITLFRPIVCKSRELMSQEKVFEKVVRFFLFGSTSKCSKTVNNFTASFQIFISPFPFRVKYKFV